MKELTCFTIMPFGNQQEYSGGSDEANFVFEYIIQAGIKQAETELKIEILNKREVDKNKPGAITKSIIKALTVSDFVIADLTGRNPNVFLELGIRYSVSSEKTILLSQAGEEIPFDIKNYRVIEYKTLKPDLASASLAQYIKSSLDNSIVDSPVYDAINHVMV